MIVNSNLEAAWNYHNAPKHSYASVHNNLHFLDWHNQPLPFRAYTTLDPLPLLREVRQTGVAALSAIAESIRPDRSATPDLEALAKLLYLSAGITRHRKHPGAAIFIFAPQPAREHSTKSSSTLFVGILSIWKRACITFRLQSLPCADCALETIAAS